MSKFYLICYNDGGIGFKAKAFWSHMPTAEDILKLEGFEERNEIDMKIVEFLTTRNCCRVAFSEEAFDWIEYLLVTVEEAEDLKLNDLFLTGYCDFLDNGETRIKAYDENK